MERMTILSEYEINCLAMAIVNMTNGINNVDVAIRQRNNDICFDFAVKKIKEFQSTKHSNQTLLED